MRRRQRELFARNFVVPPVEYGYEDQVESGEGITTPRGATLPRPERSEYAIVVRPRGVGVDSDLAAWLTGLHGSVGGEDGNEGGAAVPSQRGLGALPPRRREDPEVRPRFTASAPRVPPPRVFHTPPLSQPEGQDSGHQCGEPMGPAPCAGLRFASFVRAFADYGSKVGMRLKCRALHFPFSLL